MADIIITAKGEKFYLRLLKKEDISYTLDACDKFVGKNLYTKKDLEKAIIDCNRYFFILETAKGEFAGYIYYYLTDAQSISKDAKLTDDEIIKVCGNKNSAMGKIQSLAITEKFRERGLSSALMSFATNELKKLNADTAFVICWKMQSFVPLAKTCLSCGYTFLTESQNVWYDNVNLFCPFCKGRCRCSANIYYKNLKGEHSFEKED